MTPAPDDLTRVARAICHERVGQGYHRSACREEGACVTCQSLARAAINAMEKNDE